MGKNTWKYYSFSLFFCVGLVWYNGKSYQDKNVYASPLITNENSHIKIKVKYPQTEIETPFEVEPLEMDISQN